MTEHKIIEHRITSPRTNVLAIVCLVLALLGFAVTWLIPIVTQLAAIICGHIARSQINKSKELQTGSGVALAGLIISYLSIIFYLFGVIFLGIGLVALFAQ